MKYQFLAVSFEPGRYWIFGGFPKETSLRTPRVPLPDWGVAALLVITHRLYPTLRRAARIKPIVGGYETKRILDRGYPACTGDW